MNTFAATPVLALCFLAFFISPFFGRVLFEAEKDIGSTKSGPETGPSHGDRDRMSEALATELRESAAPIHCLVYAWKERTFLSDSQCHSNNQTFKSVEPLPDLPM